MACCFVPFYGQCASVHYYVNGSPRPSREVCGYGCSAGTCPAGLCDARSSFPNPHPDCILSRYLGKLYICTVGEQRMFSSFGPISERLTIRMSSTKVTRCGLPIDTWVERNGNSPSKSIVPVSSGIPMSTVTVSTVRPSRCSSNILMPERVSSVITFWRSVRIHRDICRCIGLHCHTSWPPNRRH